MNYVEGITYKNKYSTLYRTEMISESKLLNWLNFLYTEGDLMKGELKLLWVWKFYLHCNILCKIKELQ